MDPTALRLPGIGSPASNNPPSPARQNKAVKPAPSGPPMSGVMPTRPPEGLQVILHEQNPDTVSEHRHPWTQGTLVTLGLKSHSWLRARLPGK